MYELLTNDNFLLFCAKYYDNHQCHSTVEFYEDLKRFKYIKKLLTRYVQTGELKERLILNHFVVLKNVFGPEPLVRLCFLKMLDQMKYVKPFLVMLDILPENVWNVNKEGVIKTDMFPMDEHIVSKLRLI
jgi:hypothetical protein